MVSACPGQFPKTDGCDRLYAEDVNLLYGNFVGMRSTEAETAMNIAKLQYCQSVTDINHDYMVVDVFTDATGYNNTVCSATTTSQLISSALNGNYSNFLTESYILTPTNLCSCTYCCCDLGGNITNIKCYGCYFSCVLGSRTGECGGWIGNIQQICLTCINKDISYFCTFCFSACCILSYLTCDTCYNRGTASASYCITGSHDNSCCLYAAESNIAFCRNCTISFNNTYCYVRLSEDTWCFYCNGTGKCCTTFTVFPNIFIETCQCAWGCIQSSGNTEPWYCSRASVTYSNFCTTGLYCTLVNIVPVAYASPTKTIFMDYEKVGSGTVVYNVIDDSTGCCIACNLLPNCFYNLDCCLQCHRYEIIQCSDGVSCIKSYAIVTGVY